MAKPISYRDVIVGLRELGFDAADSIVLAHIGPPAYEQLRGGAETLVGALVAACQTVVMPAFTYQTLVVPLAGPPDNGLAYEGQATHDVQAQMFHPNLPVHHSLGAVAEVLRQMPGAQRSPHPVLSFVAHGQHAAQVTAAQSTTDAWGSLKWLYQHEADVLLLGADHNANVAMHLAEQIAGRKPFVRWAVDQERAYRLEDFPGCSRGFNAIAPKLAWAGQQTSLGAVAAQRIPLRYLVDAAVQMIRADATALLCDDAACLLCNAVRNAGG